MEHKQIKQFIEELLTKLSVNYESVEIDDGSTQLIFQIQTPESARLIGNRGDTVRALNHIVKKAFESKDTPPHFLVDVNGYRKGKIQTLENTAKLLADRARSLKYEVEMSPMSSYERMVVHSALAQQPNIKTESRGEGRERRVVICFVE